jgi:hypothetical protein
MPPARDHDALCALVHAFVSAWNRGDADDLVAAFADDVDVPSVIAPLARVPGSHLACAIDAVRFLREDIAVVDATLVASSRERARRSLAGLVAMRESVGWRIVAFHDRVASGTYPVAAGYGAH